MKFCGHTMGVPKRDIFEAIDLFRGIGYDGIEVRVKEDGQINPSAYTQKFGEKIREKLEQTELELVCLTSYYRDFVSEEKMEEEISGFKTVIDIAYDLGCGLVRSYGGILPPEGTAPEECWNKVVRGIRECADYAKEKNIRMAIETHSGSLTMSAADTVRMVKDIGMENVGILFDYAWVDYAGKEKPEEAVNMVKPYLLHCHVKDWVVEDKSKNKKRSCLLGEGELPWTSVLKALSDIGYEGYLSDEYEKYWYGYLPDASVGMRHNLEYLKEIISADSFSIS